MTRMIALVVLASALSCKASEPAESTPTEATKDLSTPAPPVDTERPEPLDTGSDEEES